MGKRLVLLLLALSVSGALDWTTADAKPKRIDRNQSKLDVRIDGLDNSGVRYIHIGWNDDYSFEQYAAISFDRGTGQILQAIIAVVANDEFYWTSAEKVTAESIKRSKYFATKDIQINFQSKGVNAYSDSSAGGPNYLGFTADGQSCVFARRFSAFGEHGGTSVPYTVQAYYCAPRPEKLTKEQAAAIAMSGMIFVRNPTGGAP